MLLMKGFIIVLLFCQAFTALAFELIVVQGVSQKKQTFITRGGKNKGVFEGKNVTFTSDDISIIAKAITVSREFTQWEIKNNYADVPFRKGEILTMYNTTEHLWALSPGEIRRKYIKKELFKIKRSLETHFSFSKGLSESASEVVSQNTNRGGFQFDGMYRKELSLNYAYAFGLRYVREVVNTPLASLINQRFMGIFEGRYYFDPIADFYNARIGLTLGLGFGQSRTETSGQASYGNAMLLPSTKLSLGFPISKKWDTEFYGAFESLRLEEEFADGQEQSTNLTNSKFGVLFRMHLLK